MNRHRGSSIPQLRHERDGRLLKTHEHAARPFFAEANDEALFVESMFPVEYHLHQAQITRTAQKKECADGVVGATPALRRSTRRAARRCAVVAFSCLRANGSSRGYVFLTQIRMDYSNF